MVKTDYTEPEHLRKLFIGGLDYSTSDDSLRAYFERFGEIVDVIVMKDSVTKFSKGFGFVAFSKASMAENAQKGSLHMIDGREVEIKRAVPRDEISKTEAEKCKKIFVGGLKEEATEEEIREKFSQFGEVTAVSIPVEKDSLNKRGFAFVEFDDCEAADKALKKEVCIQGKKVDVKKALSKNEMQSQNRRMGVNPSSGWNNRGNWGGGGGPGNYGGPPGMYNQGSWGGNQGWGPPRQGNYNSGGGGFWRNDGPGNFGNNYRQNLTGGPMRSQNSAPGSRPNPYNRDRSGQADRQDIPSRTRFETANLPPGQTITLEQYVSRMRPDQTEIFYLVAPSRESAEASPYFEAVKKWNVEIIFCYETYDEEVLMQLKQYNMKNIVPIENAIRQNEESMDFEAEFGTEMADTNALMVWMKMILGTKCSNVKVTPHLETHPCVVTVEDMGAARHDVRTQFLNLHEDERINILQPQLEINPIHPIIQKLNAVRFGNSRLAELVTKQLLYNAMVTAGLIEDPRTALTSMNELMILALDNR